MRRRWRALRDRNRCGMTNWRMGIRWKLNCVLELLIRFLFSVNGTGGVVCQERQSKPPTSQARLHLVEVRIGNLYLVLQYPECVDNDIDRLASG